MMTLRKTRFRIGLAILGLSALIGCSGSQPTQFYTLSGLVSASEPTDGKPMRLGVGPVTLPAYLDRPQVVTRNGANQMTVAEFDQWAEPLETTFQRVLTENLSGWLATDHVMTLPARRDLPLDHQVEVDVTRFDADESGQVVLDARWRIFDGRGDRMLDSGRSVTREQAAAADGYKHIAEAMSRCLGAMSAEIAGSLARFEVMRGDVTNGVIGGIDAGVAEPLDSRESGWPMCDHAYNPKKN